MKPTQPPALLPVFRGFFCFGAILLLLVASAQAQVPPGPQALDQRFFSGRETGDWFGYSVSGAGDVNGDGYADLIVGAPLNSADRPNAGAAYVYFGGPVVNAVPDVILTGSTVMDQLGWAVSGAGDVNGDGYDDVIVGLTGNLESTPGRAYVYFGGATMNNTLDVLLTAESNFDNFGMSVSGAGDVNGDGYDDVLVGAFNAGFSMTGRAYLYFGGATMDASADVVFDGEAESDEFGWAVSEAGDVNGDGYADVLVGARNNDAAGANAGAAYVYFGGATVDAAADVTLLGLAASDAFGHAVSGAGDVNGDGYADVLIGAINNDTAGSAAGQAYLFHGGAVMDTAADVTLTADASADQFGNAVAGLGDINGDGYSDVVVAAYFNDYNGANAGRAYVHYGGALMDTTPDMLLGGEAANDWFGFAVAGVDDVNGDGYPDFMVGAPWNDANGGESGRAYLHLNSLTGTDVPDAVYAGHANREGFGSSVAVVGDANGDGYADFVVGAASNDLGNTDRGRAYLYFGGFQPSDTPDLYFDGHVEYGRFGFSVSGAGDVNGDGYADVLVGEHGNGVGRAYLYYGGVAMDNIADVTLLGEAATGQGFGVSVAGAGDVNGDGYDDFIVGDNLDHAGGLNAGRAYLYLGGATVDDIADVTLTGEAAGDWFGDRVSGGGDVNGDGYADVVVGAPFNDAGGPEAGRAYVYLGGVAMDNIADVTFTGQNADDEFGHAIANAGDVNRDGYDDVLVGAWRNDAGGEEAGAAYVYYGGASMDATVDVLLQGPNAGGEFGVAVAGGGDVNRDGYSDMIVGAWRNNARGTNAGRAYVYFGGTSPQTTADIVMNAATVGDYFGFAVSIAGDVNGDGMVDALVGAFEGGWGGQVFLYFSSPPAIVPHITAVVDVPGDQGGQVVVTWTRSGYDAHGINRVTNYLLQRSPPPGASGFAWETVATVTASQEPLYSFAAPTYSDQTEGNSGITYFRVTARTAHPDEFWRSMTASGASIDNLAPMTPQNPHVQHTAPETNHLSWDPNTADPDVYGYVVYRSIHPDFTISPDNLLAQTTAITYTDDAATGSQPYFYRLTTKDVHGNESTPTEVLAALTYVNLNIYLEGPYQTGGTLRTDLFAAALLPLEQPYGAVEYVETPNAYTGKETVTALPEGAVDWVLVEVRAGTAATDSLTTRAALLMSDGRIRDLDGASALAFGSLAEGAYYVVVRHRNHLAVMSPVPVVFSSSAVPTLYDFTTSASQAYGMGAMTEVEAGVWALYSGDGDASGGVTASDQALWLSQNGLNGYQVGDYNLSGGNTASDQAMWLGNNGLNSQVPE